MFISTIYLNLVKFCKGTIDVWLPEVLSKVPLKDDVVVYLFNIVNLAVHNLKQNKDLKQF